MDPVTILVGTGSVCFGLYTSYLRKQDPSKFGKLAAMKERFGESAGNAIHVVAYSIIPIIVGIVFIITGLQGISLF